VQPDHGSMWRYLAELLLAVTELLELLSKRLDALEAAKEELAAADLHSVHSVYVRAVPKRH
jgi:hypothetical protein